MVADSGEIVVGANGQVHVAPTTAVLPTTADGAYSGDWVDLGLVSEDGATFTDSKDMQSIGAWQSFYPVRRIVTGRELTVSFVLRQWNPDSLSLAFGGGAVTGGGGAQEVQAVILTGFAGTDAFHLTYAGQESAVITRGTDYDAAGIKAAIEGTSGVTFTVTVSDVSDEGFIVTFDGLVNRTPLSVTNPTGVTGVVGTLTEGSAPAGDDYIFTPPSPEDIDERSLGLSWQDGVKSYRLLVPKGLVSETVETNLTRTGAADLPITFSATPESGSDAYTLLTNDPAFA